MTNYYLDTNAIYDLKKYPVSLLPFSYTSAFTVLELITGIKDESTYNYRKGALKQLAANQLVVIWELPEKQVFDCFDVFKDDEFDDQRPAALRTLMGALIMSMDLSSFLNSPAYLSEFGFSYFKDLDDRLSQGFIAATKSGNEAFAQALQADPAENTVSVENEQFILDTPKAVIAFFDRFPDLNRVASLEALVTIARTWLPDLAFSDDDLFFSYNRSADIFIDAFSVYSLTKQTRKNLPSRNDGADLVHTFYLKNYADVKLVSDDKIFQGLLPQLVLTLDDLWVKKSRLAPAHDGLQPVRVLQHNIIHTFENTHPLFLTETLALIKKAGLQPGITYYIYEEPLRFATKDFKSQMPHVTLDKKIGIHETFVSYLWIVCYSVLVLYDEAVAKPIQQKQQQPVFTVIDGKAITATEALFAYGKSLIMYFDPWDKTALPNPEEYSIAEDFHVTRANSLLIYAINFILCHEYAHVEKGHIDEYLTADEARRKMFEKEADDRAIELTLLGRDRKNNKSIELGILIGFCCLIFTKPHLSGGRFHPDKDWRIKNYLNQLNPPAEDPIWGMATLFFKLWDQQFGLNFAWPAEINDFKALFELIVQQAPTK